MKMPGEFRQRRWRLARADCAGRTSAADSDFAFRVLRAAAKYPRLRRGWKIVLYSFLSFLFPIKGVLNKPFFSCFHGAKVGGFHRPRLKKSDIFWLLRVLIFNFSSRFQNGFKARFHSAKVWAIHCAGLKKSDILKLG